jgi:excisionase family DNA binding protein
MAARSTPATARLLLSPKEAGDLLGISEDSVRRLVKAGKLPGSYLPLPGGSELLKLHIKHVQQFAERAADEAERALDPPNLRRWRQGDAAQSHTKKTSRRANAAGLG